MDPLCESEVPSLEHILGRYKLPISFALIILIVLGSFIFISKSQILSPYKVEVVTVSTPIASASATPQADIAIDVSGEVNNPGVYTLKKGERVIDAISAAGGLSKNADTNWVEKNINQANLLNDGQKIYIPNKSEQSTILSANKTSGVSSISNTNQTAVKQTININTGTQNELESLWGIGPVTAQKIIDNRPYSSIDELLVKKIIKQNVHDRIRDQISI